MQFPDNSVIKFFIINSQSLLFCSQASYGVEDPEYAVTQLAQTTMRSELGKLTLDKVFRVLSNYCCISLWNMRNKMCDGDFKILLF